MSLFALHVGCYETKQDLLDILIPYFTAGLEHNEFCMWVTCEPLRAEEARHALRQAVPDADRHLAAGDIEIVPHTQWYLKDGVFDPQQVMHGWHAKLAQALTRGYVGLRANGNEAWLEQKDWLTTTVDVGSGRNSELTVRGYKPRDL